MMESNKNFARIIILAFLFFWQLPQEIAGLIAVRIKGVKHEFSVLGVRFVYSVKASGFTPFGPIAIIDARRYRKENALNMRTSKLVLAYSLISKILGPLFLLFLVISSLSIKGHRLGFADKWAEHLAGLN